MKKKEVTTPRMIKKMQPLAHHNKLLGLCDELGSI